MFIMDLEECIEYISNWYFSDTVELLDLVLTDDVKDPQYSAITTLNRLWIYLQYKINTNENYECSDISSLFNKMGYTPEDFALFINKLQEEYKIYKGAILDTEFFKDLNSDC